MRWSCKKVWTCNSVPQSLTGDHQMGFCHTEDVVNSPGRQNLSHRFINHFSRVVCFNCHWSQKPNYKHLLQKRICKRAFSAQGHVHFLPADLQPVPAVLVWEQLGDLSVGVLSGGLSTHIFSTLLLQTLITKAPNHLFILSIWNTFLRLEKLLFSSSIRRGTR